MCGIFCLLKSKQIGSNLIQSEITKGLNKIQNRGYDSVGIYTNNEYINKQISTKNGLAINKLVYGDNENSNFGMGHTRWATHGAINLKNTHPHISYDNNIIGVHNGIIENNAEINNVLKNKKIHCVSDTDTEIIINYIAYKINNNKKFNLNDIHGKNAIIYYNKKQDDVYVIIKEMSLIIGFDDDTIILTSETYSLPNGYKYTTITNGIYKIDFNYIKTLKFYKTIDCAENDIISYNNPNGYYLTKEIIEQSKYLLSKNPDISVLNKIKHKYHNLLIFGCGSSYIAGLYGKFLLDKDNSNSIKNIQCVNACNYNNLLPKYGNTLALFLSQSGETADLLGIVDYMIKKNIYTIACTNSSTSQIALKCNENINLCLGREVSVAATKSFTAFMKVFIKLTNGKITNDYFNIIEKYMKIDFSNLADFNCIFVLGNDVNYPVCLESSLKLKELTYIYSQGYPIGELKHGPFALINEKTLVFIIVDSCTKKSLNKCISTYEEIKTRNGHPILICVKGIADGKFNQINIEETDYLELNTAILFQIISMQIAKQKKNIIDNPKNLAKCVTVI